MTEDFDKNHERDDDIYMVEPQETLWEERFRSSEAVCLIIDPVWKAAPRMNLYKLDGMDRRGFFSITLYIYSCKGKKKTEIYYLSLH